MLVEINIGERTKEQEDIEKWTSDAVQTLKEHGFDARRKNFCVFSPRDIPCAIEIIGKR